jgi:hypothetical protein
MTDEVTEPKTHLALDTDWMTALFTAACFVLLPTDQSGDYKTSVDRSARQGTCHMGHLVSFLGFRMVRDSSERTHNKIRVHFVEHCLWLPSCTHARPRILSDPDS